LYGNGKSVKHACDTKYKWKKNKERRPNRKLWSTPFDCMRCAICRQPCEQSILGAITDILTTELRVCHAKYVCG
jgi:hypothetical protein